VPYTLTFTSTGLTLATATVTPTFGTATKLGISVNTAGAVSGSPFTTQPRISILDAYGNVVTTGSTPITAQVSWGAIAGTIEAMSSAGYATFSDLGIRASAGTASITYTAPDLTSVGQTIVITEGASSPGTVSPGAPVITSIAPASGLATGGQVVVITGANLTGVTSVSFGASPGTEITAISATSITVRTPAAAAGPVTVAVSTAQGATSLANGYTYRPIGQVVGASVIVPATTSPEGSRVVEPVRAIRNLANARVVTADVNVPTRVQLRSLPEGVWFRAQIRIGDQWHDFGAVRSSDAGRASLRSLILTAPGNYDVRLQRGRKSFFVQIQGA